MRASAGDAVWETLFDRMPMPALLVSVEGVVEAANSAFLDLAGLSAEQAEALTVVGDKLRAGERLFSVTLTPLDDGRRLATARLRQDIPLREDTWGGETLDLVASRHLIQALLDASSDAIMLFDLNGDMLACNTVFASRFGLSTETIVGCNLFDLFPPDVAASRKVAVEAVARTGAAQHLIDERKGKLFDNSIYPVFDDDGAVVRIAVFSRDITAQRESERDREAHIAEIERSNQELEQFAYVASHDLREPLRMIGNYVDLLGRRYADKLDDEAREFISYARAGVARLNSLILDLLDYSRLTRGPMTSQPLPAAEIVTRVLEEASLAIAEAGATVIVQEGLPKVVIPQTQGVRLFQNLLSNALRYRDPHRPLCIEIGFRAEDGVFFVRDNGIGIAPEHQERIFNIFQRLESQWDLEGTGIGLAICRRVAERLGGRLWVDSVPGQGSTFLFTLPVAR